LFNAVRYSPPDSLVLIAVKKNSKNLEISISDTGPGFKDINPEKLFTVYKQAEYRSQGLYRGVGIGLYFCRRAVEAMGVKITAENAEDKGAVFRFTLPAA
jgi:two-component system sensor histidine kinase KdpD